MADQLGLSDVVPLLRPDLKIDEPLPGRGETEIRVEDTATRKFLVMKGFELSLARMLNGRRTAEEVLIAAGQIGLPISIESLNGFLRKLHREGFLTHVAGPPPLDITTWEVRAEWNEEIRRLFQEALREARADRFVAAKSRLDALLARAPATKEAQQLLHWVLQRLRPEGGPKTPTFSDVFAQAERTWFEDGEATSAENERAGYSAASHSASTEPAGPEFRAPGSAKRWPLFLALGLGLVALAVLLPMPRTATAPFTLAPRAVTPVAAPRAGTLLSIAVAEGQWVDKGAVLAKWDSAPAQKKVAALEARIQDVQKKHKTTAVAAKKLQDATGKLDRATAAAAKAEAELTALKAKGKKAPGLAKAEKKRAAAAAAVEAAQQAVAALTVPLPPEIRGELTMLEGELARAKAEVADPELVAPGAGFVRGLSGKPGQPIERGAVLARLEDSKALKVVVAVPRGERLEVGGALELKVDAATASAVVEKVDGAAAEAQLDNAQGALKVGASGEATFAGASRSLLRRL